MKFDEDIGTLLHRRSGIRISTVSAAGVLRSPALLHDFLRESTAVSLGDLPA